MAAAASSDQPLHLVLFPWLAFGHLMPELELALQLAARGHRVSFLSAPANLRRLPPVPKTLSSLVRFVPIPLPRVDGLPEGVDSTRDLQFDKFDLFLDAFDGLAAPFADFLDSCICSGTTDDWGRPDWILIDFIHRWAPPIAAKHKIPCCLTFIYSSIFLTYLGPPSELGIATSRTDAAHFMVPPPWVPFPTNVACLYRYEAEQVANWYTSSAAGSPPMIGRMLETIQGCKLISVRDCFELSSRWLKLLIQIYDRPVVPIGLVLPLPAVMGSCHVADEDSEHELMAWLDKQQPKSVVYVALGSEVPLSAELAHELGLGLELSELPFLWALQEPKGGSSAPLLPEGLRDRVEGRGLIVTNWVPQQRILGHESVGCFLTHCGSSSVLESLQCGLPMVLLPKYGDHGINARFMEEKGAGVAVPRNDGDGSFDRNGIAKTIRAVTTGEQGEELRRNVEKLREVCSDRECQAKYIDGYINQLKCYNKLK